MANPLPQIMYANPFSREGANVQIVNNGKIIEETSGDYGEEGYIYQQYTPLPNFGGNYPDYWLVDSGQRALRYGHTRKQWLNNQ